VLIPVNEQIIKLAHSILAKYNLQYFDSLIVASALEANCEILYSEDMQHELVIENQLKIINPFREMPL
jgi:predicted nucleic acid-binding protein